MVSLFKTLIQKLSKTAFFKAARLPPRCTANNYKPAAGHAIENQQLGQDSFFAKGSNCIQGKAKVVSLFKTLIQKLSKTAFLRQQGFPPARCTANNYKPAGHAIENQQQSQGSFFGKVATAFREKQSLYQSGDSDKTKSAKTAQRAQLGGQS